MAVETELSEQAKLLLLVSLLAKDRLISHNGEYGEGFGVAPYYSTRHMVESVAAPRSSLLQHENSSVTVRFRSPSLNREQCIDVACAWNVQGTRTWYQFRVAYSFSCIVRQAGTPWIQGFRQDK